MIKAAIFDLGNVLLNFDHQIIIRRMEKYVASPDVLRWLTRDIRQLIRDFDTGAIAPREFYAGLRDTLNFGDSLSSEDFARLWSEIFWKNDELLALITPLGRKIPLHMLSNTNSLHIDYAREAFPEVFEPFQTVTLSYKEGTRKPDPEIFRRTVKAANTEPEHCVYFDDIYKYVTSARHIGIKGHQYVSVQGVRDVFSMYGIEI